MDYFKTLPLESQEQAWDFLKEILLSSWFDRWIDEDGSDLDSYIEEYLLGLLNNETTNYITEALAYYAGTEEERTV